MFKKFGEISETLIDDYQKIVKMELPQDYKKFLLETNGGVFLWDYCLELEQSTEGDCLYKIADDFETFWSEIA